MFDPSVSVIGLYLRVRVKMSYTDELFIFTVLWWVRDVNGPGIWKWGFQMRNGSRTSLQMGILWYFLSF